MNNYEVDLHTHTNRSDGVASVKEMIDRASENGVKVLAITDHDVLPCDFIDIDNEKIDVKKYARSKGLNFIKGIEFSCDTYVDDVHIVILGLDFSSSKIKKIVDNISGYKRKSYVEFIEKLNKKGYKISLDEVLNYGGIKKTLDEMQKKAVFNLMAEKGYTKTWADAKLLCNEDRDIYTLREKPDPVEVIKTAHELGLIAILAHPYLIKDEVNLKGEKVKREDYINYLIDNGLDGIEASYTYDKTSYKGSLSKEEIYNEVIKKFKDKVKIISGGSDCHGEFKTDNKVKREIGECGITINYFKNNELLKNLIKEMV